MLNVFTLANGRLFQEEIESLEELARFKKLIAAKLPENPMGEGSEYNVYPPKLKEPYRSRRFKVGEDMYASIGVAREDKVGRLTQFARNFEFFGAPVGLFFASVVRHALS